ncbi:MAG: response regulator [marine benthic group bacterium]|jgi:FixJ family two-component response regulator|nr:response regulator [Gemmatimonadota bacterium]MCL7974367.1 response regulator [Gemmatimonadota bacterium]
MNNSNDATVFLVDDDASVRSSITRLLQASGFRVRAFASASEYLSNSDPGCHGCLLLDLRMPEIDGLELQDRLAEADSARPILFLTGHGGVPESVAAMKAGAADFLEKPADPDSLVAAVHAAVALDAEKRREAAQIRSSRKQLETLTPRERQVFERVVVGRLNKQIARELGVSEKTVKVHRGRVMEKMEADSLAELARLAERLGIGHGPGRGPG